MLTVTPRTSTAVFHCLRSGDALLLHSDAGTLRILPQNDDCLRVSFSAQNDPPRQTGPGICAPDAHCDWQWVESPAAIILHTPALTVEIDRSTAALQIYRKSACVFSTRSRQPYRLEAFTAYRSIINDNTVIEEISTPDGIKMRIKSTDRVSDGTLYRTRFFFNVPQQETLLGLGQNPEAGLCLKNKTVYLHQANQKISIPALLSTGGWAFLSATGSPAEFTHCDTQASFATKADPLLDFYLLFGDTPHDLIAGIRYLTGQAVMLPRWAFGFMQSQERYESAREVLQIAAQYRSRRLPLDSLVLDWCTWPDGKWGQKSFDPARFPDPDGFIEKLHAMNLHLMLSVWPNMNQATDNYREFFDAQLLLPGSDVYDAFSPHARDLYWKQADEGLFCHGLDAWWCDSCEPLTPEWNHTVKPTPAEMYGEFWDEAAKLLPNKYSNTYGLFHARGIYEHQRAQSDKRVMNLIRSAYSGSQRYGTVQWSGDISARWDVLHSQIAAGLQFCATGLPYWTLDIGGFFVKRGTNWFWDGDYDDAPQNPGYRELFTRWFQLGAFLPVFRSHGTDVHRELWNFGDEGEPFYDALCGALKQRYRLLPYLYTQGADVTFFNGTMLRALALDFPADTAAAAQDDEFMLGDALLVCPVTRPLFYDRTGSSLHEKPVRTVYLPGGTNWYDLRSGEKFAGGRTFDADAPLSSIPVYVKEGTVLVCAEDLQSTGGLPDAPYTVQVYGKDHDCTGRLYFDAGDGYAYENGEYLWVQVCYHAADQSISWRLQGKEEFLPQNLRKAKIVLY